MSQASQVLATRPTISNDQGKPPWSEEIEVASSKLVQRAKEENVRRLVLRKPSSDILMEIPITAGVAVGGLIAMMAVMFADLSALAVLVAKFKAQVIPEAADDFQRGERAAEETKPEDDSAARGIRLSASGVRGCLLVLQRGRSRR